MAASKVIVKPSILKGFSSDGGSMGGEGDAAHCCKGHMSEPSSSSSEPGRNCWRIESSRLSSSRRMACIGAGADAAAAAAAPPPWTESVRAFWSSLQYLSMSSMPLLRATMAWAENRMALNIAQTPCLRAIHQQPPAQTTRTHTPTIAKQGYGCRSQYLSRGAILLTSA
jgi:hypothetical protein